MTVSGKRIGLALSGGGYRAAAFHLGTLNKLKQLGILSQIDVLSTISGGSITGAAWCLYKGDYDSFHKEMIQKLETKNVISYILSSAVFFRTLLFILLLLGGAIALSFSSYAWLSFPVLILFFLLLFKYQFLLFPVSDVIEQAYNEYFCYHKTLSELETKHILAIGSSNLHTGRPFTFSKQKMGDSAYRYEFNPPILFKHADFPVARAVTASSCVPFAFTPVRIAKEFYNNQNDAVRAKPFLVDGGVYDNQGIQKLTQKGSSYECDIIITSDAGGSFIGDKKYPNTIALLMRTVDLFMYRIKAVQMVQNIYALNGETKKPIAYYSLGWRLENAIPGFVNNLCARTIGQDVLDAHGFEEAWKKEPEKYRDVLKAHLEKQVDYKEILNRDLTEEEWKYARETGTNLTALPRKRIDLLIRQAENFTELQLKLYCPQLLTRL